jgi:hypothetical protein
LKKAEPNQVTGDFLPYLQGRIQIQGKDNQDFFKSSPWQIGYSPFCAFTISLSKFDKIVFAALALTTNYKHLTQVKSNFSPLLDITF